MLKQLHENRITALYCRLSRDDGYIGDSCSIASQRAMLEEYASNHGFDNCEFFIDDGYSGTNFERPDFSRMLDMIEHNMVSTLVVKDLSRLGREYLKTGYYTEIVFPMHDVRFIAINDGVDSINGDNEFAPLKNVFNEYYTRDISKKIRSSIRIKASRGEYVNGRTPYGYMRDPFNRNHLIPDSDKAPVVRMIFRMASEGKSTYAIAVTLQQKKCPRPNAYIRGEDGAYHVDPKCENPYEWSSRSVSDILTNITYIGHLFNGMTSHRSFKDKTKIKISEDKWIKRMDDHEPLVDEEVFLKIQEDLKARQRVKKPTADNNLYRGLCKCADCGSTMWFTGRNDRRSLGCYTCGRFKSKGSKKGCSSHYIKIEQVNTLLVGEVTRIGSMVKSDKESFVTGLVEAAENELAMQNSEDRRDLDECSERLNELKVLTCKVYEDHVFGRISDDVYTRLSDSYDEEINKLTERASDLNSSLLRTRVPDKDIRRFADLVEKYAGITKMTDEIAHELIERIEVHEKETINESIGMRVDVYYRYVGKICDAHGNDLLAPKIGWHNR